MVDNKRLHVTSMNKIIIILLFISVILNIVLLDKVVTTRSINEQIAHDCMNKENKLEEKLNIGGKEQEKLFDKYYEEKLTKIINEKDLVSLAQKQWNYILTLNGNPLNESTIYTTDKNIKIVFAELRNKGDILPQDILMKGTLTGGDPEDTLESHLSIISLANYKKYKEKCECGNRICYEFKHIPKGTMITIKFSEILKCRLNLNDKTKINDNMFEIIVR